MMIMRSKLMLAVGAALLGIASAANAAFVPWTTPAGTVPGLFTYSGGGSQDGLFGNPIINGSSFTFFPQNFKALTSGANAGHADSRLSFQIDVAPGAIDVLGITVNELGDYAINNGGSVQAFASLFVTNLQIPIDPFGVPANPQMGSQTFSRNLAAPAQETGQWTLQVVRTLPNGWRSVRIDLDNILDASVPSAASTALIEKKIAGITVTINVPEPTSIGAALVGMGALVIRRRK